MTKAIVPGSFDPVTFGHIDVIMRARRLYGDVTVGILRNSDKKYLFTEEQRAEMLAFALRGTGIPVIVWDGYLWRLCAERGYGRIVKGLREGDADYELLQAQYNMRRGVKTSVLRADGKYGSVSSSEVRRLLAGGEDISALCPAAEMAREFYDKNTKL
ncbi:MAG: adenylyltransferase/cytidyltransferase family protein [Eubacteriales bacterium]